MSDTNYNGPERREFLRLEYSRPLAVKICRPETISRLLDGYSSNISERGVLCNIEEPVSNEDILWISFDRPTLNIFEKIEKNSMIYQGGIVGKVVRVNGREDGTYEIGLRFITRQEENLEMIKSRTALLDEK